MNRLLSMESNVTNIYHWQYRNDFDPFLLSLKKEVDLFNRIFFMYFHQLVLLENSFSLFDTFKELCTHGFGTFQKQQNRFSWICKFLDSLPVVWYKIAMTASWLLTQLRIYATIKSSKPNFLHDLLLKLVNAIPQKYVYCKAKYQQQATRNAYDALRCRSELK